MLNGDHGKAYRSLANALFLLLVRIPLLSANPRFHPFPGFAPTQATNVKSSRQENMHDLLLPRGRSIYHQMMEKLVPLLEKAV